MKSMWKLFIIVKWIYIRITKRLELIFNETLQAMFSYKVYVPCFKRGGASARIANGSRA